MCGIVGYVGMRSAQQVLLDGLEKLEYRGYDSAGVALTQRDGIRVVKSKGRLSTLRSKLEELALPQSGCGIGHTRWATHGEPSDVNSHPHSTPRVSIVHNGIIENYGALKERLVAKGYTFTSETDTEVLVKLIDSCYQGEPLQALQAALAKVRGSYALAVLFKDYPDTIFAVKRESPLIVGWGEGENFVASDIPALLKYTRSYSVLEEGDMAVCTAQGIRFYNEFGEAVEREKLTADWDMEAAEKGGYPHFMLKEINEEPAAITATVSPRVENGLPELRIPELTDEKLRSIGTVHLVGCGTAMHAGMVGKTAIEALARVPAEVDIASEFRYRDPILKPEDLVINTHVCRGNFHSTYASSGAYDSVAKTLLARENVTAYYLEFDDARSGGFEPLAAVSGEKKVVLGLVTTKRPELEDKAAVIARIHDAAKYIPLDRLCLSPQCGFASCEIGNKLTEAQQWAKLALVKEIAEEVWG